MMTLYWLDMLVILQIEREIQAQDMASCELFSKDSSESSQGTLDAILVFSQVSLLTKY